MNWELLTSPEFEKAVKTCKGVCLLPVGVIEKHGDHLPLGMDLLYVHAVSSLAAKKEPAMVFPPYYFGQIFEARHQPGTVAIKASLLLALLENACDEIGRNGFTKIILVNGHGGNSKMLPYFCQLMLEKERNYTVYFSEIFDDAALNRRVFKAKVDEHGGEKETSTCLYLYPALVKLAKRGHYGMPKKRLKDITGVGLYTGIRWYSDHPGHYCSDEIKGTPEKGKAYVEGNVAHLCRQIKAVKHDSVAPALTREFHRRAKSPQCRAQ